MSEQVVRPTPNEKDKYEKKEVDRNIPDKPREPGEAIPDTGEAPEHEGATEDEVGDITGPGAGFDKEPEKVNDKGGVAPSSSPVPGC
jgi:hypothetical protein